MRDTEVVELVRYVAALCPAQKVDAYTCDAWRDVLAPYELAEARGAVARLAARQPFISVSEIIEEIARAHGERLAGFRYEPVAGDDDPVVFLGEYRQQRAAVAEGRRPPEIPRPRPAIDNHDAHAITAGIGRIPLSEQYRQTGPLAVACPICRAPLGRHCRTPSGTNRRPHGERRRAARDGAGAERLHRARTALAALTPEQRAELLHQTAEEPPHEPPEEHERPESETGP